MESQVIQELQKATVQFIQEYSPKVDLQLQVEQHELLSKLKLITATEMQLPPPHLRTNKISERTFETALDHMGLRISLYYLPKGSLMPLHNHPGMIVISYILQGCLKAKLYSATSFPKIYQRQEVTLGSKSVSYIDGLRTTRRNLHSFEAIQDTFIIDIIFPDYDDEQRDYFCFQEEKNISEKLYQLKRVACDLELQAL